MPRGLHRLTALKVERQKKPGLYSDGGNLYLQVGPTGGKSWIFRFARNGRSRDMGLGPLALIDLTEARQRAHGVRRQLFDGVDPLAHRARKRAGAAAAITFHNAAKAYIAEHKAQWKNPKHVAQWYMTLLGQNENGEKTDQNYCAILHKIAVGDIDTPLVLQVLKPIWQTKTETASRLRGRIESVLGWAAINGHREGDNPARWKGHLDQALPAKGNIQRVKHHAALPYADLPDFMIKLRQQDGVAARALQFAIFTAVRTGDLIGQDRDDTPPMQWSHLDLPQRLWTIPKTKNGAEHRVPLSDPAVAVLAAMRNISGGSGIVFPGQKPGQPMSSGAMLRLRDRMAEAGLVGEADLTPHGFRASFKSWASDQTNFERDVIESCLAHTVGDKLEAAYRRSDFLDKRRRLMAAWAGFVMGEDSNVVALHG